MKTIAIIEDDQTIGDLLEEVLQKEGYQVERAYSGTEAVYLLSQQRPDLALLDLMLPGLSGEEVLPHLAGVPVIVVSDGRVLSHNLKTRNLSMRWVKEQMGSRGVQDIRQVFLMTVDEADNVYFVKKEEKT